MGAPGCNRCEMSGLAQSPDRLNGTVWNILFLRGADSQSVVNVKKDVFFMAVRK